MAPSPLQAERGVARAQLLERHRSASNMSSVPSQVASLAAQASRLSSRVAALERALRDEAEKDEDTTLQLEHCKALLARIASLEGQLQSASEPVTSKWATTMDPCSSIAALLPCAFSAQQQDEEEEPVPPAELQATVDLFNSGRPEACLLYTSPSPRDQRGSRMPSSA